MNEKGRKIEINGKQYNMVYTSGAMLAIMDKYGDVEGMAEEMKSDRAESARIVPWLVSLLCNQGIMLETGDTRPTNPELLSSEKIELWTMPKDWENMMGEAMLSIAIGNGTYHETQEDASVDVVLEELEKNAEGAEE